MRSVWTYSDRVEGKPQSTGHQWADRPNSWVSKWNWKHLRTGELYLTEISISPVQRLGRDAKVESIEES